MDNRRMFGECYGLTKEILICETPSKTCEEETYIHELIEHIDTLCEMNLEHWKIQTMAVMLHQALSSGHGRIDDINNTPDHDDLGPVDAQWRDWVSESAKAVANGLNRYGDPSEQVDKPDGICMHNENLELHCARCVELFEEWRLDKTREAPQLVGYPLGNGMPGSPNGR